MDDASMDKFFSHNKTNNLKIKYKDKHDLRRKRKIF